MHSLLKSAARILLLVAIIISIMLILIFSNPLPLGYPD